MPDGRQRCWHHADHADVELIEALDHRASELGLRRMQGPPAWGRRLVWPYGPNIDVGARLRLVDWAEPLDLKLANVRSGGCPHWPRNHRRCSGWVRCTSGGWVDHVTCWVQGRGPALYLAQPYHLDDSDVVELRAIDADPGLAVTVRGDAPWYGSGALSVEIWRSDAWQGVSA